MFPGIHHRFLPMAVGTVTDYNASDRYVVRKDLPKEERYITTVE